YEDNQSGIDNLKNELAKKVSKEEYCQIMAQIAEKTMAKYNVKADELDPEIKKDFEKLKSGEIKEPEQVNEIEKKVAKNAGEKGSSKKLNQILQEAQKVLKLGDKNKIKE
ncbi:8326_t:CDS:1, partial [Ambispora leptoticha]